MQKGFNSIYNKICDDLDGSPFFEWIKVNPRTLQPGQICNAIVWYVKKKRWYLEEDTYNPYDESQSTWFAKELKGTFPSVKTPHVMKYFDLEADEYLITTNSKVRPVVLLKNTICDWWNPTNSSHHIPYWLCLPLFRYKDRHIQSYVLSHQKLEKSDFFYFPQFEGRYPGLQEESCGRFHSVQMLTEGTLKPIKAHCIDKTMNLPFKLSEVALRIVLYHYYKSLEILQDIDDPESELSLFKEEASRLIDAALSVK